MERRDGIDEELRTRRDDAVSFLEHCILVASGSPLASDGEAINEALKLIADAFWPDLREGAHLRYNMEAEALEVETPYAHYAITVRAVDR